MQLCSHEILEALIYDAIMELQKDFRHVSENKTHVRSVQPVLWKRACHF